MKTIANLVAHNLSTTGLIIIYVAYRAAASLEMLWCPVGLFDFPYVHVHSCILMGLYDLVQSNTLGAENYWL